ncbi:MAG TPA: glycine--tRNA ligase [Candidatus Baltobacteraceae bacterium]|jgi:glycyl-tRNA synthetase|nr:glycine--tRNA ligase [Candidatus Baltobacteraceae bacterium]
MDSATPQARVTMDEITALAKRRGFIFQSSEIYGGLNGFWDYGPLGAILKRNVKNAWWRETVELRDDVVGFDSTIIMHPLTWKASGHIDAFHDKLVDCKVCKHRFRFDHLKDPSKCPDCGSKDSFTEPRNFNLMMKTQLGPMEDTASTAYLRPETAQGIFVNFKNVYQTARKRPPFGIAQIGKSFRNEITPGNFTYRVREFEQAELEYFVPDDGNDMAAFQEWVDRRKAWYSNYGVSAERLRFYELTPQERPHYAKAGIDVEYLFPWGWGELESIAHRGTYDLDAHMTLSGKDLRYFDEGSKTHYTPILIESSAGMDRTTLTMLIDAYDRERSVDPNGKETERVVLRFHPYIAPVQVAVFSLARNKPELVERARAIEAALRPLHRTQYDEGNIGQLYRRQDEIGTPFCVTVDYETLDDGTVTVRERDSMKQERVDGNGLERYLGERLR